MHKDASCKKLYCTRCLVCRLTEAAACGEGFPAPSSMQVSSKAKQHLFFILGFCAIAARLMSDAVILVKTVVHEYRVKKSYSIDSSIPHDCQA